MEPRFWAKWGLPLLSVPIFGAAYYALAYVATAQLRSPGWFLAGLGFVTLSVSLLVAAVGRAGGLYEPGSLGGAPGTPERQGVTGAQLALILVSLLLPRLGIDHNLLVYGAALLIVGIVGRETIRAVAGRRETPPAASAVERRRQQYGR